MSNDGDALARQRRLRAKAVSLLAQREHSAHELREKLARHGQTLCTQDGSEHDLSEPDPASQASDIDAVLQWLQSQGYLDEQRFVESRLHVRASRFGNQRIRQELSRHGLTLDEVQQAELKGSELSRARVVRARKFGDELPVDAAQRLKQMRFLAGRGFTAETIRRALQTNSDDEF